MPLNHGDTAITELFTYNQGEIFFPGAGKMVYVPLVHNPLESLIATAVNAGAAPNPLQPPPIFIPTPLGIVSGLQDPLGDFEFTGLVEDS